MRTNLSPEDYLKVVAKKKPRLQALIDTVDTMTQEEIDAVSEPLWIRQALTKLKANEGQTQSMYVQARINQAIAAEEEAARIPKPTYEVRVWDQPAGFVGTESNGKVANLPNWQIEISTGDSLMIINENYIRVADSTIAVNHRMMDYLEKQSKFVGYMTLDGYKGFHRALLNQKHKHL